MTRSLTNNPRTRPILGLILLLSGVSWGPSCTLGFTSTSTGRGGIQPKTNNGVHHYRSSFVSRGRTCPARTYQRHSSRSNHVTMMAAPPILDDWRLLRSGAVVGTVSNHPTIEDGDIITTSPLADPDVSAAGMVVTTQSGSKYKLGEPKKTTAGGGGGIRFFFQQRNGMAAPAKKQQQKKEEVPKPSAVKTVRKSTSSRSAAAKKAVATSKKKEQQVVVPTTAEQQQQQPQPPTSRNLQEELRRATRKYGLTGQTVGDGKYLLAGSPQRSTSGKSQIWTAYRADSDGLPIEGAKLTVKLSPNIDAIERESKNYRRVARGLFSGRFVNLVEFLRVASAGGSGNKTNRRFETQCALVIESGEKDLKALLARRFNRGLEGRSMRDAAAAAGQCVQAMHSSGMVWTDLKTENFVIMDETDGENGLSNVKGIDLESAMPVRGNPVDYSPEACPPEFAQAYVNGDGADFVLDPSYDMWSLGMMLYELSTGRPYFTGKSPLQITKTLNLDVFEPDVSAVKDEKLRDLISQCLNRDPKKRPSITQFLLHPYFLTSGIGPISF